ncbi:MAG: hypothetical protein PUF50_06120 [Erysipelotrichaceae bacterium]|nr:hypothetical protein [Erysipelotrichaceae bacterium]
MKKVLLVMICLTVMLTGCQKNRINIDEERAQKYASYIIAIQDNESFLAQSPYYSITTAMNKIGENEYRYDVIIDQPLVAMYEIQVLAVEKNVIGTLKDDKLMPSLGILEADVYNLIPNQVDVEKGYPAGISISGVTDQPEVTLEIMVIWSGFAKLAQNRDFFQLKAIYTGETNE